MQDQADIKKDYDALCGQYSGIPEDSPSYTYLWSIFLARRQGGYPLDYEVDITCPALDIATMLKQLSYSSGAFSLKVGSGRKDYSSPALVDVLKKSLTDALLDMVEKITLEEDCHYMSVNYGKDGSYSVAWDYPAGELPQEDGLSKVELEMILKIGECLKDRTKKFGGRAQGRWPVLGQLVLDLYPFLPPEWNNATKNAFLAEFLYGAGFLDFYGASWLEEFKDKGKGERDKQVRDWIDSYEQARARVDAYMKTIK
jgi:hypothetical protein